jgi:hypothetical protein
VTLDPEVSARLFAFQQGDLLPTLLEIPVHGPAGIEMVSAPDGAVIVSQTCDVVQDRVDYVHVARRVILPASNARQARSGRWIRYAALPALGDAHFADVSQISAVHKAVIVACERVPGLDTEEAVSKFGKAVGRNFSRFALPDAVSKWLAPLADSIQTKGGNLASAEGRLLDRVIQLRIQSVNGWAQPPYDLRLIVVVKPGVLPTFAGDEIPYFDEALQSWLYDSEGRAQRSPGDIAERIESTQDPKELYYLWSGLGDAWAARCKFKGADVVTYRDAILDTTSEVLSSDQFTLTMQADSELLDLDHLSVARTDN